MTLAPSAQTTSQPGYTAEAMAAARRLGIAWLPLFFVTNHRLYMGEGSGAANAINGLAEVMAYGFACFMMVIDRRNTHLEERPMPFYGGLYVFPIWALSSVVWGQPGPNQIIRSLEIFILAVMANVTIERARATPGFLDALLVFLLKWTTWIILGLTLLGFALGPLWARVNLNESRYTWVGAHPAVSGAFLSSVIPLLLVAPRSIIRLPLPIRAGFLALTSGALLLNHSRTSVVGAVIGVVFAVWLLGRTKVSLRILLPPYAIGGVAIGMLLAFSKVSSYALRDQPTAQLLTLNNRTRVWAELPDKLTGPGRWVVGLGIGSTKTAFVDDFAWAGNAHNSVVALLLSMGIIGLVIGVCYLLYAIVGVWATMLRRQPVLGTLVLTVMATFVVQSVTGDVFAQPNFGLAWIYICIAITIAERQASRAAEPAGLRLPR